MSDITYKIQDCIRDIHRDKREILRALHDQRKGLRAKGKTMKIVLSEADWEYIIHANCANYGLKPDHIKKILAI